MLYKMSIGGAETFVYNLLSGIDDEKYRIDICIQGKDVTNKKLYSLCKKKGCHIHVIPAFNRNYPAYVLAVERLLKMQKYDVVHIHMNALINCAPVYCAMRYAGKIVVHSHNTQNNMGGGIGRVLHCFNRRLLRNKNITRVSCGEEAGEWLFGDRSFTVLDNAISIPEFAYNAEKRREARKELGICDKKVIGHIGRFVEAKNHGLLLEIFAAYIENQKRHGNMDMPAEEAERIQAPDTVLVMIGDGELLEPMKQKAHELAIEDSVIFAGSRTDSAPYYSAFDCLLFPSKFEGLPFVLIEAQVNGLPIVASDRVTAEMDVTGNIKFVPLDASAEDWIGAIENALIPVDRLSYAEKLRETKYNVENMVRKVESIYSG